MSPPPKSMGRPFSLKKPFHGEQTFWGKYMRGGGGYIGLNDQIMQGGRKSFTNAFTSNLNSVNLENFPGHGGRHTERIKVEIIDPDLGY